MPTREGRIIAIEAIVDELDSRYGELLQRLTDAEQKIWVLEAPYRGAAAARKKKAGSKKGKVAKKSAKKAVQEEVHEEDFPVKNEVEEDSN